MSNRGFIITLTIDKFGRCEHIIHVNLELIEGIAILQLDSMLIFISNLMPFHKDMVAPPSTDTTAAATAAIFKRKPLCHYRNRLGFG